MGGPTNIRSGWDFIKRAGSRTDLTSVIPDFGKQLIVTGHEFTAEDLSEHLNLLKWGQNGRWHTKGVVQRDCHPVNADQPSAIAKVHVSEALREPSFDAPQDYGVGLIFFMVVQGRSGSLRSKLVVQPTRDGIGSEMLFESANGYSVVFSGAMLKSDWAERGQRRREYDFKRVASLEELTGANVVPSQVVKIWC